MAKLYQLYVCIMWMLSLLSGSSSTWIWEYGEVIRKIERTDDEGNMSNYNFL